MRISSLSSCSFFFALSLASGCDGGGASDAGADVPVNDTAPVLDAPTDAPLSDAPLSDAPLSDAGSDAGELADAGSDAGSANTCEAAGGTCAPVIPDACNEGIVGDPTRYSCGSGVGSLCCLPISTAPFCDHVGTEMEGWYRPDGRMICNASCAGATATCENPGTRSEGWYADSTTAGCESPAVEGLVEWLDCTP